MSPATPPILFASGSQALISTVKAALLQVSCGRVQVETTAQAALDAMLGSSMPSLAFLDAELPGMEMGRLLAAVRAEMNCSRLPVILIADEVTAEWSDRAAEGVIDDVIPATAPPSHWRFRLEMAMRASNRLRELDQLREAATHNAQMDALTGIYNRTTLLSMLFRETDRVQRMKTSLSVILFDLDDFGHWNSRLGTAACDELLVQVVGRVSRLQRTYDLFGRVGQDEFLLALPGCSTVNAALFAERMRAEVFASPFHVGGHAIRLSACSAISASQGRSPIVVLREAEQALDRAKSRGPESIVQAQASQPPSPPVGFLSPTSGDDLLAW